MKALICGISMPNCSDALITQDFKVQFKVQNVKKSVKPIAHFIFCVFSPSICKKITFLSNYSFNTQRLLGKYDNLADAGL